MGIRNVIGIYGISNIPKDIAAIFDELAVTKFTYYADNDASGERGASNLREHCSMNQAGRASRNIASSRDPAYRTKATPMTCYATTFQIFRRPALRWMRYPSFHPA